MGNHATLVVNESGAAAALASYRTLQANLTTTAGRVRTEHLNGREYLVAPIRMLVPGVLNGSKGPLYYPPEEVSRNPDDWNGMPLLLRHPVNAQGQHVTGRDPKVWAEQGLGFVFRSNASSGPLDGEAWFDVENTTRLDRSLPSQQQVLPRVRAGKPVEVSTGLYTQDEQAPANSAHEGVGYTHIARNYRPDHMAVLPDDRGACSVDDGCGIHANAKMCWGKPCGDGDQPTSFDEHVGAAEKMTKGQLQKTFDKVKAAHSQAMDEEWAKQGSHVGAGDLHKAAGENSKLGQLSRQRSALKYVAERNGIRLNSDSAATTNSTATGRFFSAFLGWLTGNSDTPSEHLDITPEKACQIVKDGTAHGQELTEAQKGMFGAKCGEGKTNATSLSSTGAAPAADPNYDQGAIGTVEDQGDKTPAEACVEAGVGSGLSLSEAMQACKDIQGTTGNSSTRNDWSEAAREAAAIARKASAKGGSNLDHPALKGGGGRAGKATRMAEAASERAINLGTPGAHLEAAQAHQVASKEQIKAGNPNEGAAHRFKAENHIKQAQRAREGILRVLSRNPEAHNTWSEAAREAAILARKSASSKTVLSDKANEASRRAMSQGSRVAHQIAAREHTSAAHEQELAGNIKEAADHHMKAAEHRNLATRALNLSANDDSLPWDECIAKAEKEYGDKSEAQKVCGAIRAKYGNNSLLGNAWSEEARQAAAEARRASAKAKETGKKSDHQAARAAHLKAAEIHEGARDDSTTMAGVREHQEHAMMHYEQAGIHLHKASRAVNSATLNDYESLGECLMEAQEDGADPDEALDICREITGGE